MLFYLLILLTAFLTQCRQSDTGAGSAPPPIEIRATVHPAQAATITAQVDGEVRAVDVREGAPVVANGVIAELSNPSIERDAAVAHAQLQWVDARLHRGRTPRARTVATPRNTFDVSRKIVEMRRQRLETMRRLRKTNDVTTADVQVAEIEYLSAVRDFENEQRSAAGPITPGAAGDDLELLKIERDKNAAEDHFAAQRRELLQVRSPISGTVTRIHITTGQAVALHDPIAEVSDTTTLHVAGAVAPELLRYIHVGTPVEVKIFTVPPRTFADEIESVIPVQATGTDAARTATVVVSIPNPDRSVPPNTDALITLRTR